MRHTQVIFVGSALDGVAEQVMRFLWLNASTQTLPFLHLMRMGQNESGQWSYNRMEAHREITDEVFLSDLRKLLVVKKEDDQPVKSVQDLTDMLIRSATDYLTISNPGDNYITYLVVFAIWDKDAAATAKSIAEASKSLNRRYEVDMLGLATSLATAVGGKPNIKMSKEMLEPFRIPTKEKGSIERLSSWHRFILLGNVSQAGVSLGINEPKALSRIIADYVALSAESYDQIYPVNVTEDIEVTGIGMSELFFDKYYFIDYLLHQAYLKLMDRERINETEVDILKVSQMAKERLEGCSTLMKNFEEKVLVPALSQNMSEESIIRTNTPKIDELIKQTTDRLQDFVQDPNVSFPEKEAALAMILGEDNSLLVNYLYDLNQPTVEDYNIDPISRFLQENDRIPGETKDKEGTIISPSLKVLDITEADFNNLLNLRKTLHSEILSDTNFLRTKEAELAEYGVQQEEQKEAKIIYKNHSFVIGDVTYHTEIKPIYKPFDETWMPNPNLKAKTIDLRDNFTPIKSQGTVGACVAFAMSSVYEYVLKKCNGKDLNLSERFLYYFARKTESEVLEDEGTTFNAGARVMMERGVCEETMCPYEVDNMDIEPSIEAMADAERHKVIKAMNVNVKRYDICAALQCGYPVLISLKLYESFVNCRHGFVKVPTSEEQEAEKHGRHAMVICGVDVENNYYIVRNSWGTNFGDKGYCYIPFSYIEDRAFCEGAFIITEVKDAMIDGTNVSGVVNGKTTIDFGSMGNAITALLLSVYIDSKCHELTIKRRLYEESTRSWQALLLELSDPQKRRKILDLSSDARKSKVDALKQKVNEVRSERMSEISSHYSTKMSKVLKVVGSIVAVVVLVFVVWYNIGDFVQTEFYIWSFVVAAIILASFFVSWWVMKKKYRHRLEDLMAELEDMNAQIQREERELKNHKIRLHVAGMFIDRFNKMKSSLSQLYLKFNSLRENLIAWYNEERVESGSFTQLHNQGLFKPIIDNDTLDSYFQLQYDNLLAKMHLYDFVSGYELNHNNLPRFQTKLRDVLMQQLESNVSDFSLYDYLTGKTYPYLQNNSETVDVLLPSMDRSSEVFMQMREGDNPVVVNYISLCLKDQVQRGKWGEVYPKCFTNCPAEVKTNSANRLLLMKMRMCNIDQVITDI